MMKVLSQTREQRPYFSIVKRTYDWNGKKELYELIDEGEGVTILALVGKRIILFKQFRPSVNKLVYQFPAGIVNAGEPIARAARREFTEESGYACAKLVKLATVYKGVNRLVNRQHLFFAVAGKKGARRESHEDLRRIELLSPARFEGLLKKDLPWDVTLTYLLAKDRGLLE